MMNVVKKAFGLRHFTQLSAATIPLKPVGGREFTRTLWNMSRFSSDNHSSTFQSSGLSKKLLKPSINCACGCSGALHIHTKGERELVEFLAEEIIAEKKAQKKNALLTEIDGFKVKLNKADVELEKKNEKERIVISFNVNHTVDADDEAEVESAADKPEFAEMRSKPQFEVDIIKGSQTLSFTCSFLQGEAQEGQYNDVFGIDEITLFEGEWNDKVYAVAGDVLDGYLYDLLMNLLEEKGISNEFVHKLSDFSTSYEHSSYIGLLEGISKFTIDKK